MQPRQLGKRGERPRVVHRPNESFGIRPVLDLYSTPFSVLLENFGKLFRKSLRFGTNGIYARRSFCGFGPYTLHGIH
jgi:hypothetical protein